jgi:hypothetical protein
MGKFGERSKYFSSLRKIRCRQLRAITNIGFWRKREMFVPHGGYRTRVGEPTLVPREYSVQWLKPEVNLV